MTEAITIVFLALVIIILAGWILVSWLLRKLDGWRIEFKITEE